MATDQVFCSECGAANESDAVFCESCGHPLAETETAAEAAPASARASASAPAPVQEPARTRRVSPTVIGIVAVLIAGVAGAMVYRAPLMALIGSKQADSVATTSDSVALAPSPEDVQLNDRGTAGAMPTITVENGSESGLQLQVTPGPKGSVVKARPAPQRAPQRSTTASSAPGLPGGVAAFPDDFKPPAPTTSSVSAAEAPTTTTREAAPAPAPARIAGGSVISLKSSDEVCTDKTREGTRFRAVVQQDIQGSNGAMIPRGSVLTFVVDRLKRAAANQKPEFSVAAESIELSGQQYPVQASVDAVSIKPKKASLMGALIGAAATAAAAKAAGGDAKQTVAGAVAGGAAGAVIGNQLKTGDGCIEKNGNIRITLQNDITIAR